MPLPSAEAGPSRPLTPVYNIIEATETLNVNDTHFDDPASVPLEPSDISTLLSVALLQALAGLDPSSLPMSASLLYSAHILPNRPAYIPKDRRDDVLIAKSEWKKLAKWMKEVSKEGLVKIKETKGEIVVQG